MFVLCVFVHAGPPPVVGRVGIGEDMKDDTYLPIIGSGSSESSFLSVDKSK